MISKRAGLNESLIQRYFKSKSNLLVEVTYSCIDALSKGKPPPAGTPQEEIYRFLVNKLKSINKNINFSALSFRESLSIPKWVWSFKKETFGSFFYGKALIVSRKRIDSSKSGDWRISPSDHKSIVRHNNYGINTFQ